jgi:uncharacterized protein with HEPN domain
MTAPRDPRSPLQDLVDGAEEIEPVIVWRIANESLPELEQTARSLISEIRS